jgi:hypothetical protein
MGFLNKLPGSVRKVIKYTHPAISILGDDESREDAKQKLNKAGELANKSAAVVTGTVEKVTDKVIPNKGFMKEELEALKKSGKKYEESIEAISSKANELHKLRMGPGRSLIRQVEDYINSLANTPKNLSDAVNHYQNEYTHFDKTIDVINQTIDDRNKKIGIGAALLMISGPSSWGIGTIALGYWQNKKCLESAKEAIEARKQIEKHISVLSIKKTKIIEHLDLTSQHVLGTEDILISLKESAPDDYKDFSNDQKLEVGSLINHITALSGLLNQRME